MKQQEMIDKIYEVIADKTLNFWCRLKDTFREYYVWDEGRIYNIGGDWFQSGDIEDDSIDEMKIIWHPVMIWDILNYLVNSQPHIPRKLLKVWKELHKKIDEQSEECITFIYNLIKDATN